MVYSVRVDRIGKGGARAGAPRIYEATDEADAVTIAAYEVDGSKPDRPRVATVIDADGRTVHGTVVRLTGGGDVWLGP